jgi:hypothetical protein
MSQMDYRQMANQCLSLAETATDEQHKSVLLRAAAKLNELADRQECRRPRDRRSWPVRYSKSPPTLQPPVPLPTAAEIDQQRFGAPALAPAQQSPSLPAKAGGGKQAKDRKSDATLCIEAGERQKRR